MKCAKPLCRKEAVADVVIHTENGRRWMAVCDRHGDEFLARARENDVPAVDARERPDA